VLIPGYALCVAVAGAGGGGDGVHICRLCADTSTECTSKNDGLRD
jgi:hypothetical protein